MEFDQGLYSAMARLRDALGDTSESPRYIETVARRGYRFIPQVRLMGGAANSEPLAETRCCPSRTFLAIPLRSTSPTE